TTPQVAAEEEEGGPRARDAAGGAEAGPGRRDRALDAGRRGGSQRRSHAGPRTRRSLAARAEARPRVDPPGRGGQDGPRRRRDRQDPVLAGRDGDGVAV